MNVKQKFWQILVVVALLISACAPARATDSDVDTMSLEDVQVEQAQIAAPSEGDRITDPVIIATLLTLASGDETVPEDILKARIASGLPITETLNIAGTDYAMFQGSSTGLEPGPKSGYVVGYSAERNSFIKISAAIPHRENTLITGHEAMNAVLKQMWITYGDQLPDGFPRQMSPMIQVEFPSGNRYLAYEAPAYGRTINQMLLDGALTPEQAAPIWRSSLLIQIEVAGNTGFTAPDPNPRNQAVIGLKNGELVAMPFDFEAKGAKRGVLFPEMAESMVLENIKQSKKVHVNLDASIPEELRLKYPVFGQVADVSGFTFFNLQVGEETMTLRAVLSTPGLKSGEVHAIGGKLYQMIQNGEVVVLPGETIKISVTAYNGVTDDVTLTRTAVAPSISNAQLGKLALLNVEEFVFWTVVASVVDGIPTEGIRRIEMSADPQASMAETLNLPVTFVVNPDDIVAAANNRRAVLALSIPSIAGNAPADDLIYERALHDAEFSALIAYETGYESLSAFRAGMDGLGITPDVWSPVMYDMFENTTYPFIIDYIGESGRVPMNLRVSSYVEDGIQTLVFWGELNADESQGILRPFLVFQQTSAGWVSTYVGEYAENPYILATLTSWEENWGHDAVCYPGMNPYPGAQFVLTCQPPAP